MTFEAAAMLGTAALIFALATSYKLWFGPASRKTLLHKTKESASQATHLLSDQVDPREHLSITKDDGVLSSDSISQEKKEDS